MGFPLAAAVAASWSPQDRCASAAAAQACLNACRTMCNDKATRTVIISNRTGIHVRAAMEIDNLARRFDAKVRLSNKGVCAEDTTVWELLKLGAWVGDELLLEATGPEAQSAVDALADFIANQLHQYDS
jgi:phosphotransferase system HPr (HPr) family protein